MKIGRRQFVVGTAAMLALPLALHRAATAQEDSLWDTLTQGGTLRDANPDGNTSTAMGLVESIEPILSFDTAHNLQAAIRNYEEFIAARGSWEPPSQDMSGLVLGKKHKSVKALKQRLMINGDMTFEKRVNDRFDDHLDAAVRLFQARHGLIINGTIDEPTLYALAVPADYRLNQLRLNAQRIEQWASTLSDRYVVVNVPAATIEAIEGSQVAQRHTAVVGKVDRATPILNSKIHQVKFNPFWTVPKSIIRKDLIRYMNEDPEYLTKFKIRIFDGKEQELAPTEIDWSTDEAVQYTFRQDPGAENSMGHCKIDFYNPHDVYLHDTPQKALFSENARFHSSGCVRVDQIDAMVAWLLRDNGGWDLPAVQTAFASNERLDVPLTTQVPIHTTYITAWANRQGTVSFRDDVYGFDAQGQTSFAQG